MEIVLKRRRKKTHAQPRHILVTLKETAGAAKRETGRGTGRGASPGPARSVFPPPPGRASPPRRRRRRRAARGQSEPSAARSRERERERASELAAASRPGRRVALFPRRAAGI